MPEKTLKEKVEAAKQEISECIAGPPCISCKIITEALTALEERVNAFNKPVIKEALEGYLEFLGNLPDADERPQLPRALYLLKKALEYFKEAPDGK